MAKKNKAFKAKKKREICLDSPTDSLENGGKDNYKILSNPDSETNVVSVERVQSRKGPKNGWSGKTDSSSSSSGEESRWNLSKKDTGKSVGSPSLFEPIDPIERVELVRKGMNMVKQATPNEIHDVADIIQATPVEKHLITQVAETNSARNSELNSGVTPTVVEVIEDIGIVLGDESSSPEAVVEKSIENVDCQSLRNEEIQIVSALPPTRLTSWKCCCGLFELVTAGSHR
ncbi:hypothetical protein CKAN_02549300 [Cinnamomum micranthum f. kanehirae]|uniref:Uncharacterized protein n=1 Tax=Cinnamomum micranthum f. kanehirae TaxID=337451 RepID=A0A443PZB3_9MAGN|nr:hypothetical protein CKAN_02549300 [Cinnamomum micranthum f. kanehirae]